MSARPDDGLPPAAMPDPPGLASAVDRSDAMMFTELVACVVVIAVVAAFAIDEFRDRVTAARLLEPLLDAATYRPLWVESLAVTGRAAVDSIASEHSSAGARQDPPRRPEPPLKATAGISGGVPMAYIRAKGAAQPQLIELRPALRQPDSPLVVWLCDAEPPPPGWSAPPPRQPRVPDHLLPSACRKGWTP